MHFSTIAITLLGVAASASASSLFARQTGLPDCALPCTASADLGGCVVSDTHCLCTNAAFVNSTTTCVEKACTGTDLSSALKASQDLCAKVGVTLAAPSSTAAASSSATGSANATSSASGSAASASATTPTSSGSAPGTSSSSPSSASSSYAVNALFGAIAAAVVAFAI